MKFVRQNLTNSPLLWFVSLLTVVVLMSCVNNRNLADLDLGNGRHVKIYTGWADTTLPIYAELFIHGKSVDISVIDYYEGPLDASVLSQYRYNVLNDKARQAFVVTESAPDLETSPVIVLDSSMISVFQFVLRKSVWIAMADTAATARALRSLTKSWM